MPQFLSVKYKAFTTNVTEIFLDLTMSKAMRFEVSLVLCVVPTVRTVHRLCNVKVSVSGKIWFVFEKFTTVWECTKMLGLMLVCDTMCLELTGKVKTFITLCAMMHLFLMLILMTS